MEATLWMVAALLAVLAAVFLAGKGAFLLAGYNTASPKEKAQYNEKRLCRVAGGGFLLLAIMPGRGNSVGFPAPLWPGLDDSLGIPAGDCGDYRAGKYRV